MLQHLTNQKAPSKPNQVPIKIIQDLTNQRMRANRTLEVIHRTQEEDLQIKKEDFQLLHSKETAIPRPLNVEKIKICDKKRYFHII